MGVAVGIEENAVSPLLFHTAEPTLYQCRSVPKSVPQPVLTVTVSPGNRVNDAGNRYR
jgi:hypothetical protein